MPNITCQKGLGESERIPLAGDRGDRPDEGSHVVWPPRRKKKQQTPTICLFPVSKMRCGKQLVAIQAYKPPSRGLHKTGGVQTATAKERIRQKNLGRGKDVMWYFAT